MTPPLAALVLTPEQVRSLGFRREFHRVPDTGAEFGAGWRFGSPTATYFQILCNGSSPFCASEGAGDALTIFLQRYDDTAQAQQVFAGMGDTLRARFLDAPPTTIVSAEVGNHDAYALLEPDDHLVQVIWEDGPHIISLGGRLTRARVEATFSLLGNPGQRGT